MKGTLGRHWSLLSVAVVGAIGLVLSGCSGAGSSSGNGLAVWHQLAGSAETTMKQVIAGFNSAHPHEKLANHTLPNDDADTLVRNSLTSSSPPAVVQSTGYYTIRQYAKDGLVTDITSWWNSHKKNFSFADSAMVKQLCGYQGKVYCIPFDTSVNNLIYYNDAIVKKYKLTIPKTIGDFEADAQKLKGTGVSTDSLYSKDGWPAAHWWYMFATQLCGVDTVNKAIAQKGAKWNDPCFLHAAENVANLAKAGVFPQGVSGSDYNAMMSLFLSGKAAFMVDGSWFSTTLQDTPPKFDVKVAPFVQADPAKPSNEIVGGLTEGFAIPAHTKNKKAAYDFLDYLSQKSSGDKFSKAALLNLIKGSDEALPADLKTAWSINARAFSGSQQHVVNYFESLVSPAVGTQAMLNGVTAVASGTMEPKAFVDSVQSAAEQAE